MPIVDRPRMLAILVVLLAAPAPAEEPSPKSEPNAVSNTVRLDLQITGVGEGWKVEIRPASPGSRFRPVVRAVEHGDGGPVQLDEIAIDARSLSADRDCAFAIVLIDPEGTAQTFKRSVRLVPQPDDGIVPEVAKTFYLRTTSVASKDAPTRRPN